MLFNDQWCVQHLGIQTAKWWHDKFVTNCNKCCRKRSWTNATFPTEKEENNEIPETGWGQLCVCAEIQTGYLPNERILGIWANLFGVRILFLVWHDVMTDYFPLASSVEMLLLSSVFRLLCQTGLPPRISPIKNAPYIRLVSRV